MPVLVMDVGIMRMAVGQWRVGVLVRMRLASIPLEIMRVLVMRVVPVEVCVRDRLVSMYVLVPLGQMQPDPRSHQGRSHPERP